MIKKLKRPVKIGGTTFREKINELVDTVNNQQIQLNNHECRLLDLHSRITALEDPTYHEAEPEPADPYAEQRKHIGCLCKFRDNYEDKWHFGILEEIYQHSDFPFGDSENFEWPICEPVKPDDDIIYKGE